MVIVMQHFSCVLLCHYTVISFICCIATVRQLSSRVIDKLQRQLNHDEK